MSLRLEARVFREVEFLLIVVNDGNADDPSSEVIDRILGQPGSKFEGEVCLSDGWCEHYLRLRPVTKETVVKC